MPLKLTQDELPSLNMTPMIDVVFLLLIFFMVGTRLSDAEREIQVKTPLVRDAGQVTPPPSKRQVLVYADGRVELDGVEVTVSELEATLTAARAAQRDLGVIVRGDGTGHFQQVAEVLSACRAAGVEDMGISVRVTGKSGKRR